MSSPARITNLSQVPVETELAPWIAWTSLASACLAWMFDAMDLQIFTIIMVPSVSELIGSTDTGLVAYTGGLILAGKLVAGGLGGIAFGVVADRFGRSRAMIITVLVYSVFTGLSGLAQNWWQLAVLQALAGIGIGGEWAAGAALVAETWPEQTRSRAMQVMQMSFCLGFFLAALLNLLIGPVGWRWVLAVGAAPAGVTLIIRQFVPESARWTIVQREQKADRKGIPDTATRTIMAIFASGMLRRTTVGVLIATTMMIGAFSTSTLLPTWIHQLLGADQNALAAKITSQCFMLANAGAILGYLSLIWLTNTIGRRWSYFLIALGCVATNLSMFTQVTTTAELLWFMAVYGFFVFGGFGTFAVYLPELFPTRIRATGQGFCWNMARAFAATGPILSGTLLGAFGSAPTAGLLVTGVYVIGLVVIWFGPETRGVPLQDW